MMRTGTAPLEEASSQANIFELFERQAIANPAAVAVIDDTGATTYGDLAEQANAVCRHLLGLGLVAEQPVGVLMQRRARLLAVLLGIWKAGGAYVPFDPREPPDRLRRMLLSSGCQLVLGDRPLLDRLHAGAAQDEAAAQAPLCISLDSIALLAEPGDSMGCAPGGHRLAYLLFTSGSTGQPKAVEVEHGHALALLRSAFELLRFGVRDRYLAASTIAFDASITELFLPLVSGASLLLRDRSTLLDPRQLARDVREHGVTVLQTGPSVWAVLLAEVPDFPRVRVAITHGEAVSPELARRLCACGDEVWNLYGPTETTVWATGWRLAPGSDASPSPMSAPIGRPLPHVRAHVVDEHGLAVGDGVEGELWLGGPSLARGYRGNEDLTRERFVEFDGERVYRSGDLVLRDSRGVLHYFGRNDDQMKVRGVRVEPSEVEAAILRDTRVAQAAATWFPTPSGTRAIVAAVVKQPRSDCSAQELHEGLASRLPGPMIPARFLFVPWLPMTTSGKVDRLAIRRVAVAEADAASAGAVVAGALAPAARGLNWTEAAIATIWKRMLGVAAVASDDHFFVIGGDSLAAVQMMVEVEDRFGLVLPVHLVFEAPTLEALARRVDRARDHEEDERGNGFVYPLVATGSGAPLFFISVDLALARRGRWTVPCPLYAVVNWAAGSGFVQAKSLAALAASHLEDIRRIQPLGPYRLGGYSLGGLIALEMAQQLRDTGEVVELLFLLDPMAPEQVAGAGMARPPQPAREPWLMRVKHTYRRIARVRSVKGLADKILWRVNRIPVVGWFHYMAVHHYLRHPNAVWRSLFPRNRWRAFWFAAQRMIKGYSARPYEGPVLAVFCQQGPRGQVWKSLLGPDSRQYDLDAPHLALFESPAINLWMGWLAERVGGERGD